jgi:6-pyruvoyltetrahydropterin/6-carboxytetrahydropterin synthase
VIVRLSKRYGFAASHRLYSPTLTEEENRETYGKCANPHGHGHNYEVELTVCGTVDPVTGRAVALNLLNGLAEKEILAPFRYRNLNEEVTVFQTVVPTTENLGVEVDRRLRAAWPETFGEGGPRLEKVCIWETDRNICEIGSGSGGEGYVAARSGKDMP